MSDYFDIASHAGLKLRILLIGDSEAEQQHFKQSLEESGLLFELKTAGTAANGLKLAQENAFDFIFVYFKLPDMNLAELLKSINTSASNTPVLIITSPGNKHITPEALHLGATDFIPHNMLTPEGLYLSIRSALRLHQLTVQHQATDEALGAAQSELDVITSNSPVSFWNINHDGVILHAQGKLFGLLNLDHVNMIGTHYAKALKAYPVSIARIARALQGETIETVDEINNTFIKLYYTPVYDKQGRLKGTKGFATDISEHIKYERELKQAKELAEQSVRVKEQFIANISHEIRTPMNGIIGLTNVLQHTALDGEQEKYLRAIKQSANNLMLIINDLLDFSNIKAQKLSLENVAFDLYEVVNEVIELMDLKAKENNNILTSYIDHNVPLQLIGDPLRLKQVLLNLISNAVKFTNRGQIKLLVHTIHEEEEGLVLEFTVEDTGIGIPEDKLKVIFESFNQGSNSTARKYGGTGLGLTISKNLIEMQGGIIAVRSQPSLGSAFTFTLPYKKQTLIIMEHPPRHTPDTSPASDAELGPLRVLLAEDNEINQLLINTVLEDWNLTVDTVENGLEAVEHFQQNSYDIILMDMQMPEMDGYEAIGKIRESGAANANIPIVALTAHATSGEVDKCLAAGADAYVSKPFEPEELYNTLLQLTQKK